MKDSQADEDYKWEGILVEAFIEDVWERQDGKDLSGGSSESRKQGKKVEVDEDLGGRR